MTRKQAPHLTYDEAHAALQCQHHLPARRVTSVLGAAIQGRTVHVTEDGSVRIKYDFENPGYVIMRSETGR